MMQLLGTATPTLFVAGCRDRVARVFHPAVAPMDNAYSRYVYFPNSVITRAPS